MTLYRLTWTETLTAVIEAESADAARQRWCHPTAEFDDVVEATDNRHDYDLEIEEECPAGGEHQRVRDSDENDDMRTFSSRSFHCEECGVSLPNPQREP